MGRELISDAAIDKVVHFLRLCLELVVLFKVVVPLLTWLLGGLLDFLASS